jgi:outer membrane protein
MTETSKSQAKARFITAAKAIAATVILAASGAAAAQTAGTWLIKAGYNKIMPKVSSGDLSAPSMPGTKVDVDSAASLILTGAYMFTDNVSTELFLGLPYKHDLNGAGSIKGVGKIGTVEQLPPTLLLQYRFLEAKSVFRPYVGVGVTYAIFQKETGSGTLTALTNPGGATTLRVDNAWGSTAQLGATYAFDEKWFADMAIQKTYLKTTTTLSTGQKIDTRLDPVSINFSIGYRF